MQGKNGDFQPTSVQVYTCVIFLAGMAIQQQEDLATQEVIELDNSYLTPGLREAIRGAQLQLHVESKGADYNVRLRVVGTPGHRLGLVGIRLNEAGANNVVVEIGTGVITFNL